MPVLTIAGSPSASSRSARLLGHVHAGLDAAGIGYQTLALRDLPAAALLLAERQVPAISEALDAVSRADAIVLATPIYKAAYSGLLKTFLDLLPQRGFEGKFVWPIATGGSLAHALAIDYALRPVLASLSSAHIGRAVFALDSEIGAADGKVALTPTLEARVEEGLSALLRHTAQKNVVTPVWRVRPFMRFAPQTCRA